MPPLDLALAGPAAILIACAPGAVECRGAHAIGPADAFVIPPGETWALDGLTSDARVLVVTSAPI